MHVKLSIYIQLIVSWGERENVIEIKRGEEEKRSWKRGEVKNDEVRRRVLADYFEAYNK